MWKFHVKSNSTLHSSSAEGNSPALVKKYTAVYRGWTKNTQPTNLRRNYNTIKEKSVIWNRDLLKCGLNVTAFRRRRKMFKMSVLIFHAGFARDRLLGSHVSLGLFTAISYGISSQSCCKMWICGL